MVLLPGRIPPHNRARKIMKSRYIVIMAGGRGERFWPQSRLSRPKHLQAIVGRNTLFSQTVRRVESLVPAENLLIITHEEQRPNILRDCPRLHPDRVIAEPMGRDTAAAVGLATALVQARNPEATYAILPADHVIRDNEGYGEALLRAFEAAEANDLLIAMGIMPSEPATGYGYIRAGEAVGEVDGVPFYRVEKFVEKPDRATAQSFLDSGNFFWNAGMFIWKASVIERAFGRFKPTLHNGLRAMRAGLESGKSPREAMAEIYPRLERISVDYAILERAPNVAMVKADFDWDDVGSWPALARHSERDEWGNAGKGSFVAEQSANNIVVSEDGHLTALIGVENLIVVHTPDASLVCHRDKAQDLKKVVETIGRNPDFQHLV